MDIQLQQDCEQFIANKQAIDKVFPWTSGLVHTCCAGIYSSKGMSVDIQTLEECREMLKARANVFSNFRNIAIAPVTAMLASGSEPSATLDNSLKVYKMLKKEFYVTVYLPITAIMIAQTVKPNCFGRVIKKAKNIYSIIRSNYHFLTYGEDITLCVLLAMTDKDDNDVAAQQVIAITT